MPVICVFLRSIRKIPELNLHLDLAQYCPAFGKFVGSGSLSYQMRVMRGLPD